MIVGSIEIGIAMLNNHIDMLNIQLNNLIDNCCRDYMIADSVIQP